MESLLSVVFVLVILIPYSYTQRECTPLFEAGKPCNLTVIYPSRLFSIEWKKNGVNLITATLGPSLQDCYNPASVENITIYCLDNGLRYILELLNPQDEDIYSTTNFQATLNKIEYNGCHLSINTMTISAQVSCTIPEIELTVNVTRHNTTVPSSQESSTESCSTTPKALNTYTKVIDISADSLSSNGLAAGDEVNVTCISDYGNDLVYEEVKTIIIPSDKP